MLWIRLHKKSILIGLLFLLAIAGCTQNGDDAPITDIDVRQGTDGITMEFTENAPPEMVFENSDFSVGIDLKNKGASDINNGYLVFGFEEAYVSTAGSDKVTFSIKGKSMYNPEGDEELIKVTATAGGVGEQSETHPAVISATVCYPYKTIFGSDVCIDTDIYREEIGRMGCSVEDLTFPGGQGAPVAVTKVKTKMLPDNKLQFLIHIENKGNGGVISSDKVEDVCSSKPLKPEDFNKIKISASLLGKSLECGDGTIRLKDGGARVECKSSTSITDPDAYTTPLGIILEYGYTSSISTGIVMEKSSIY